MDKLCVLMTMLVLVNFYLQLASQDSIVRALNDFLSPLKFLGFNVQANAEIIAHTLKMIEQFQLQNNKLKSNNLHSKDINLINAFVTRMSDQIIQIEKSVLIDQQD